MQVKYILLLLIIFSISQIFAQKTNDRLFTTPDSLILYSRVHTLSNDQISTLKAIAIKIQNQGFVLQEHKKAYAKALAKIDKAIVIWKVIKDTLNEANSLKYRGYILAKLDHFKEAKQQINQAIFLFTIKHKEYGLAVSQFDLSRVFDLQAKYDSSLYYAYRAKDFWNTQRDTFRIATINNQLINVYYKMKGFQKALIIHQESQILFFKKPLHWQALIDFYYLSEKLFAAMQQMEKQKEFDLKYKEKIKELKLQNIEAITSY